MRIPCPLENTPLGLPEVEPERPPEEKVPPPPHLLIPARREKVPDEMSGEAGVGEEDLWERVVRVIGPELPGPEETPGFPPHLPGFPGNPLPEQPPLWPPHWPVPPPPERVREPERVPAGQPRLPDPDQPRLPGFPSLRVDGLTPNLGFQEIEQWSRRLNRQFQPVGDTFPGLALPGVQLTDVVSPRLRRELWRYALALRSVEWVLQNTLRNVPSPMSRRGGDLSGTTGYDWRSLATLTIGALILSSAGYLMSRGSSRAAPSGITGMSARTQGRGGFHVNFAAELNNLARQMPGQRPSSPVVDTGRTFQSNTGEVQ